MHPLGLYLAINDDRREHRWAAEDERRPAPAPASPAPASPDPTVDSVSEHGSRLGRLAAILRRRITPVARA
jgi:hypothetical protein